MEPVTFALVFAALSGGVAVARIIAEYRESNRVLRRTALRRRQNG